MNRDHAASPILWPRLSAVLFSMACVLAAGAAWGHGISLFATAEGSRIQGTLKYADGTRITGAPVRAVAPDGTDLAETLTDDAGRFELNAQYRCAHRLVGDAGEGHRATYTIPASELPDTLPEWTGAGGMSVVDGEEAGPEPVAHADGGAVAAPAAEAVAEPTEDVHEHAPTDLDVRIEQTLSRQLAPLREQLHDYENKIRIRDFIGGVGYVFGLMGLVILFKRRGGRSDG